MVNDLSHSFLTHEELAVTGERIAGLVENAGLGLPYVDGIVGLVRESVGDLNTAKSSSQALELTSEVQAADGRRDKRFKSFRGFISYKRYSEDAAEEAHAEYLWSILNKHGLGLWSMGLSEQTARIDSLTGEIDNNSKALAAIAGLGASDEYEALKRSQTDFENTYRRRVAEASEKESDPRIGPSRKKLIENLEALLVNLAMAENLNQEAGEETLSKINSLIGGVNEVIASVMATAKARITRSASANEDSENEEAA